MVGADPPKGEESPQHEGVEHAHEGTVAHHTVLQNDLNKHPPKALRNVVVRKIPVPWKYRKKPAVDGSEEEPNTHQGNHNENRLCQAAQEEGGTRDERDERNDRIDILA